MNISQALAELDEGQRQAVMAGTGLLRVRAGAGTGKTKVLVTRIANLILNHGQDPRTIIATTFTNKAAREMRHRLLDVIGHEARLVKIGTLDSLAARMVRRHWHATPLKNSDFLIADPDEGKIILHETMMTAGLIRVNLDDDEKQSQKEIEKHTLRKIARWKENGISMDDVMSETREIFSRDEEELISLYRLYQEALTARNMVEFADLPLLASLIMEKNPNIRFQESSQCQWLLVDEFQDTNAVQLRFLNLLASVNKNLLVVGDDDQCLYSFRGSMPRLMERAPKVLPELSEAGFTDANLVTNRRCTEQVLAPANLLVDYNRRDEPKVLRSGREGAEVEVIAHTTDAEEAKWVIGKVEALVRQGADYHDIAVLARTARVLEPLAVNLAKSGIPHAMQVGIGFLERTEVKDILAYFKLAVDPSFDLGFSRISGRPTRGLGPASTQSIISHAQASGVPFHEAMARLSESEHLHGEARHGSAKMSRHLSALSKAYRAGEETIEILDYILQDIGYSEWAFGQTEPPKTLRTSLESLREMATEKKDFMEFITDASLADTQLLEGRGVHVGTLHGAKGLEWPHVIIVGFEEGVIPSAKSLREASQARPDDSNPWNTDVMGGIEEERRLAHVGMTRSKETLSLSFAGVRGRGPMRVSAKPSRFLREAELDIPKLVVNASIGAKKSSKKSKREAYW